MVAPFIRALGAGGRALRNQIPQSGFDFPPLPIARAGTVAGDAPRATPVLRPTSPFAGAPIPAAAVDETVNLRNVKIPQITDDIDPVTGKAIIKQIDYTIREIPAKAFEYSDEIFRADPQRAILSLFEEIENVATFDRLYLITEMMRRYRPQMSARQGRALEQSLDEATRRLGIPEESVGMRIAQHFKSTSPETPKVTRTYMSSKALLDEVNDLGKTVKKTGDPFEIVAKMNRYDQGADGGILGRAIMQGTVTDAADQRLIQNQINYWRREALKKVDLTEADFQGLRGLRYTDDMPESEAFNRTIAAMRSASSEDEVAMILVQSRGKVISPNYTDVLDDLASRMVLDIAGDIPLDAKLSGMGRSVPGSPYYLGTAEDVIDVDRFFVQNPFIGPLMQSPVGLRTINNLLKKQGLPPIDEKLLVTPPPRPERTRGVNITPGKMTTSPFEELGSMSSGTAYGRVFRGLEDPDPMATIKTAIIKPGSETAGFIKPSFLDKGTAAQRDWSRGFAEKRMQQLVSSEPSVRAKAAESMRLAVAEDLVEPGLLAEMRRIAGQGVRTGGAGVRYTPGSTVPAPSAPAAMKMPMNFKDGDRGLRMASGNEGKSTMDLILEGSRTGTTRSSLSQFNKADGSALKVGDIVEFTDRSGRSVRVEITKAPYQLPSSTDPATMDSYRRTWSKYEGWDPAMYDRYAGQWQIQYKLLDSPGTVAPRPTGLAPAPARAQGPSPSPASSSTVKYSGEGPPKSADQKVIAELADINGYKGTNGVKDIWEEFAFVERQSSKWTVDYLNSAPKQEKELIFQWVEEAIKQEPRGIFFPSKYRTATNATPGEIIDIYRSFGRKPNEAILKNSIESSLDWNRLASEASLQNFLEGSSFNYSSWRTGKIDEVYRSLLGLPERKPSIRMPGDIPLFDL